MSTSFMTGMDELVILHDDEGNDYLLRRSSIKEAQVPSKLKSKISEIFRSETSGYGVSLAALVSTYFGVGEGDEDWDFVSPYDYNENGKIDWEDVQTADEA